MIAEYLKSLTIYGNLDPTANTTFGLISWVGAVPAGRLYSCNTEMAIEALVRLASDVCDRFGSGQLNKTASYQRKHIRKALQHLKLADNPPPDEAPR